MFAFCHLNLIQQNMDLSSLKAVVVFGGDLTEAKISL